MLRIQKNFFRVIFVGFLLFLNVQPAHADYWAAAHIEGEVNRALTDLTKYIDSVATGLAKSAFISSLNEQVNTFINGAGGGKAAYIENWQETLISSPEGKAKEYVNEFLTQATKGRGSSSGYESATSWSGSNITTTQICEGNGCLSDGAQNENHIAWLATEGVVAGTATTWSGSNITTTQICEGDGCLANGSYPEYLETVVGKSIDGEKLEPVEETSMSEALTSWDGFSHIFDKQERYAAGLNSMAQQKYLKKKSEEEFIASTQSIAYSGYLAKVDENENVLTPGSDIKSLKDIVMSAPVLNVASSGSGGKSIETEILTAANEAVKLVTGPLLDGANQSLKDMGLGDVTSLASTAWNIVK